MHNLFGKTPTQYGLGKDLEAPKRPIFYPKDAPMDKLLPLEASLKNIKSNSNYDMDPPVIAIVEKGFKLLRNFVTRFNGERRMNRKLEALDNPEVLAVIRKIDPDKLIARYNKE